jgi:hypothetical protein
MHASAVHLSGTPLLADLHIHLQKTFFPWLYKQWPNLQPFSATTASNSISPYAMQDGIPKQRTFWVNFTVNVLHLGT